MPASTNRPTSNADSQSRANSRSDLPLPEHLRGLLDMIVEATRRQVQAGQRVGCTAYIGNSLLKSVHQYEIDASSFEAKEQSSSTIRDLAKTLDADFVLTVIDGWGLARDQAHNYKAIIEQYGSIGDSPYRVSIVSFLLHVPGSAWAAAAELHTSPHGGEAETFGDVVFEKVVLGGTFANLLPDTPVQKH